MKNRVKRIFSAVTAICIAGGAINADCIFPSVSNGTAFAESDGSVAVNRLRRQAVTVSGGPVSVSNGKITLYYDPEMVSVKEVMTTAELSGMTTVINKDVPGKIVVEFTSPEPKRIAGHILYADYEYSTDLKGIPQFGIGVDKLETKDKDGNVIEADKKCIYSSECISSLSLHGEYIVKGTNAQGNIYFDIDVDKDSLSPVNNGECTLFYDPEVLQFVSYGQVYNKNSVLIDINETEPGKLKIAFASDQEIDSSEVAHLVFKPLKNAVSEMVLKTDELSCVMSEDRILTYPAASGETSLRFGINIPGLSDRLQFNRKGTLRIGTHEDISATNGMFTVKYDYNELEFKEIRLSEAIKGAVVNTDVPGRIVIGFASVDPVTLGEVIADIDFAFPAGLPYSMSSCYASVDELENENEDGTVTAVDPEQIFGYSIRPEYDMELRKADQSEDIEAVVKIERNCDVTNGSLTFDFDPEVLAFDEVLPAAGQTGLLVEANEIAPGKISCVFVSDSPVTRNSELLILKFKPLKSSWTKVELDPVDIMNTVSEDEIYEYVPPTGIVCHCNAEVTEPAVTTEAAPVTSAEPVVTTADAPVVSEAPVVTTEAAPVISEEPSVTTEAAPVISEEPSVTTEAAPVISEEPAETTEAGPVISEAPVVTTMAGPVISEAPVVTTVAAPVISEAPAVTTVAAPVISEAPAETTEAAPVVSESPSVTTADASVTTPEPSVTSPVEQGTVAGDINGDDSVTSRDLITLIKMILGTEKQSASSDLNGDGKTDSADLLELKKILAK